MLGIKVITVVTLVLAMLMVGGQRAEGSFPPPAPDRLYLATYGTVELSAFLVSSLTCTRTPPENGRGSGSCLWSDPAARQPLRLDQRVKAAFRGTATLTVPENTDSISISYGQQPAVEYSARPTVIWPIPGSGTYYMTITLERHDEFTTRHATYAVPLYVPRS